MKEITFFDLFLGIYIFILLIANIFGIFLLFGCSPKYPDGTILCDGKITQGTVEDFCKSEGNCEYYRNGKVMIYDYKE